MPTFDIVKQSKASDSFRSQSIIDQFDLQSKEIREHFSGEIPIENKQWHVGVIVGASGTGKTTIAKQLFGHDIVKPYEYTSESVIDDMPSGSVKEIAKMFNRVGFSSPPSWLKPYSVLSNGEKMRVDLARALMEENELIVFDEFTSVVDRQVAKIGSHAISKTVKAQNKQFIAISCHYDILDWLEPDWVFDTNSMSFFLSQNTDDQPLSLKLGHVIAGGGTCLGAITI